MYTVRDLRDRYLTYSDRELLTLLRAGQDRLTPNAWQALGEELARRQLSADTVLPDDEPVVDPAITPRRYPKASLSARVSARFVDSIIAFGPVFLALRIDDFWIRAGLNRTLGIVLFIFLVAWGIFYELARDGRRGGQSFGKQLVDLMVVNVETNEPCTPGASCLRNFTAVFLSAIPFGVLIEPLLAIFSREGRRLGDRAANTQVIDAGSYDATRRANDR